MAITLVDSQSNSSINGGSPSVLFAALENDVVVVSYMLSEQSDFSASLAVVEEGYAQQGALYVNDTQDVNFAVFVKRMGATPDSSVQVVGDAGLPNITIGVVQVFRGVDTVTALDATSTTASGNDTGNPVNPAITTVTDGAWVVACAANSQLESGALTVPTNYTNDEQLSATDNRGGTVVMASREIASAGAETPGAWAGSEGTNQDCWAAITLALRPAEEGGEPAVVVGSGLTTGLKLERRKLVA